MVSRFTRKERKLLFIIGIVSFLMLLFWVTFSPKSGLISHLTSKKQLQSVKQENNDLRIKNQQLKEEIERLKNDQEYQAYVARKEYGLLKKNEVIYRFDMKK